MEWYGSNLIRRHQHRFRPFFFLRKTACQKYFFQILSQKNTQILNLKNPDLDLIRRIHPESVFYGSMIRFWTCPKNSKSVFGFGNPDLDFPEKTHPNIHVSSNGVSKKSNCWLCRVLTTLTTESLIGILETGHVNLSRQYRESQTNWFEKRGIPWHIQYVTQYPTTSV